MDSTKSKLIIMTDKDRVRSNKYSTSLLADVTLRYNPAINMASPISNIVNAENVQQESYPQKVICLHFKHLSLVTTSSNILSLQI